MSDIDLDAIEARAEDDLPAATGDWRDLRYAITQADPTFMQRPEVERDYLWGFAERVIDRFPGLRARCAGCRRQFVWQQGYRCFDCSAALCKDCIKSHSVREQEQEIARLKEDAARLDWLAHNPPNREGKPATSISREAIDAARAAEADR